MLYVKKDFTEGLIQIAILLSLCGLRVDLGMEPYLPHSWHDMILGPTSALTQNQFHNLRNRLEEGHSLHPKSVDLEQFFTSRRLLGWARSLDRLQVPPVELETWVVQQELELPPGGFPARPSLPETEDIEADRIVPPVENQAEDEELSDDGRSGALLCQTSHTEPLQPPVLVPENPCSDLELQWQDLLDILQPENPNVEMMTSFNPTLDIGTSGAFQDVESDPLPQLSKSLDCVVPQAHQPDPHLQHGLLDTPNPSELPPDLLPLTPSTELDDHSPTLNRRATLRNSAPYSLNYTDLLADNDLEDFVMGANNFTSFSMNLFTQEDGMESENLSDFGVNFQSCDLPAPNIQQKNNLTQDLLASPSCAFLLPEEDEDGLPSPLTDLLEDLNILEGMRLLDIALEEGLGPDMAARLGEEAYTDGETFQQETGRDQRPPSQKKDGQDEMDSDSGLSVDFSHSPASSYVSEGSTPYSSTSTPSTPSPSWVSAVESPFSEDEDREDEDDILGSDMELEVTVKQEKLEEEEMGAVGGDVKQVFPANYMDHKLLHSFNWLEHIGHDHTYNQPLLSTSRRKMAPKQRRSLRHHKAKPYHNISDTENWNRDERRAQALKIPFSNELIIHLPVEDFNDLLSSYQLTDEQLTLVRDIRRRGKNKIAAQNCRKRKHDVLLSLESEVSDLRHHFSQLLREKRETLRHIQEMKQRLRALHKEIFSHLKDEDGRQLNATEHVLQFGPNDRVTVASVAADKNSKKQKDKK
ncbi:endoplasmic reticulum membrane sensor NFE2L1a [Kryptolebias marmoratus]|uniref:Endoplasmic reticulum membrane sensor NFE2L1 n=1 Tax=Kryptolebias marmoratus TaxID=37003 RepID=A0A3Q3BDF9_KRYMA|nr:endoplasmic reticulum membrane sensor NFE2L1a [Kryptolebias marmoratus]